MSVGVSVAAGGVSVPVGVIVGVLVAVGVRVTVGVVVRIGVIVLVGVCVGVFVGVRVGVGVIVPVTVVVDGVGVTVGVVEPVKVSVGDGLGVLVDGVGDAVGEAVGEDVGEGVDVGMRHGIDASTTIGSPATPDRVYDRVFVVLSSQVDAVIVLFAFTDTTRPSALFGFMTETLPETTVLLCVARLTFSVLFTDTISALRDEGINVRTSLNVTLLYSLSFGL